MKSETSNRTVHVHQGQFKIGSSADMVLTTVLGSCVSACLHDPVAKVGGMNHFLLPDTVGSGGSEETRYGVHLMEVLLNALLQAGAQRQRVTAKVFGGARVVAGLSDIGARNAEFVVRFLKAEGIPVLGQSLKGDMARRLQFWPASGRTRQLLLSAPVAEPKPISIAPSQVGTGGDLELF